MRVLAMVRIDKIRINDAKRLRQAGLMSGSLSLIEQEIRTFAEFPQISVFTVSDEDVLLSMVKMHHMDRKRCRVHLDYVFAQGTDKDMKAAVVAKATEHALIREGYHKITVTLSGKEAYLEECLLSLGYVQEAILADEIMSGGLYEDAGLFRLLSADYRAYNCCFVPFAQGVAVVTGDSQYVTGVKLHRFGSKLHEGFVLNVARQLRLVDGDGVLINDRSLYEMSQDDIDILPGEVAKAYVQISNYFSKTLSRFDFNYRLPYGTDFQRKVWSTVAGVGYGNVASYEDIAMEISGGDRIKAKNLTRAVGNACSDNPMMLLIPCHRIIGKDGKIAGFAAGVEVQDFLLTLEAFSYVTSLV
ncbi:O-6-methylguanine DNA methyltransferase [Ruminococcaceae bacterium YRB3002]|nr:O-6-methylguanine DNA methyltransferase [Ruminococcaceae bacterium YRB3002]